MKNKNFILGLTLVAGSLMFTGCGKKQSAQPADPDKDFGSSTDAGLTEYIISDLNEICAQSGDGQTSMPFYSGSTGTLLTTGTITAIPASSMVIVTFANTGKSNDGKIRNGSITFNYASSTNGAMFYRQPGYRAVVTATGYVVDGYQVDINSMVIANTTKTGFVPSKDSITWSQTGTSVDPITNLPGFDVNVWKPNDPDKITAKGTLTKMLLNTNSTQTFSNINTPINWKYAWIGNYGKFDGVTSDAASYKVTIDKINMVKRNFTCAPDKIFYPEKHPNITGIIQLDVDPNNTNLATKKEIRYIDYGPSTDCDYNTTVTIKGISYSLDINQ